VWVMGMYANSCRHNLSLVVKYLQNHPEYFKRPGFSVLWLHLINIKIIVLLYVVHTTEEPRLSWWFLQHNSTRVHVSIIIHKLSYIYVQSTSPQQTSACTAHDHVHETVLLSAAMGTIGYYCPTLERSKPLFFLIRKLVRIQHNYTCN